MHRKGRFILSGSSFLTLLGMYLVGLLSAGSVMTLLSVVGVLSIFWITSGRPLIAANIMLVISSLGTSAILGDLALRATFTGKLYYRPEEMFLQRWPRFPEVARYKKNVSVSREAFGDLAALSRDEGSKELRQVEFITDSFGFRNERQDGATVYDVIMLGDSLTAGTGITQEETWVSLMGSRYNLNIYNLAIPGSPWQSYVNLAFEVDRLNIRSGSSIVLSIFSGNDLDEPYGPTELSYLRPNNRFEAAKISLSVFQKRSVIGQLMANLRNSYDLSSLVIEREIPHIGKVLFLKPYQDRSLRTKQDILRHKNYIHLKRTLDAIKRIANEHRAEFKVIFMPSKVEVYNWLVDSSTAPTEDDAPSSFSALVGNFCLARNIEFVDLEPFLKDYARKSYDDSRKLLWWKDDTHWNALGHDIVADIVYRNVLESGRGSPDKRSERAR